MLTTEILEKLKELQDILVKKNVVEANIKESPSVLASQEELLAKMKREYIENDAKYRQCREEIAHLEAELFEAESAREKAEKAMDSVSTQREYEALDNEIRSAAEKEQALRKEIQKLTCNYQYIDEELKRTEEDIDFQEKELKQRKEQMLEEVAGYEAELEDLKKLEEEVSPGIDSKTKFNLERIIKSKAGVGVVAVSGNVCNGCHMVLSAQFANDVRAEEDIKYCPYCSRILYYADDEDSQTMFFDNDASGSLADLDDFSDDYDDIEDDAEDEFGREKMIDFDD